MKKKPKGESPVIGFRCPQDVLTRIDKFCERTAKKTKFPISRSGAIVHFLERGLAAEGLGRKKTSRVRA